MVVYNRVSLFNDFTVGGRTYYEDSLHKPRVPAPADANDTPPALDSSSHYHYDNVTPRKGHELDELELPIPLGVFDVLLPGEKPKVVCI